MIDDFLEFEKDKELFSKQIDGINFWHLIRFDLFSEINKDVNNLSKAHNNIKRTNKKYFFSRIKQLKNIIQKNFTCYKKQKDIVIFNHERRVKDKDLYVCLYTSDIVKEFKSNTVVIESPYQFNHFTPIPENEIIYTDIISYFFLIEKIKKKFSFREIVSKEDVNFIKQIIDEINIIFDISLDSNTWISKVSEYIMYYELNYKIYKKILEKIRPKVVIEVVSYNLNKLALNQAAYDIGIPTIELQHGTMGQSHIAYNFKEKMKLDTFPQYIFTFGDYWKENTRFPINLENVKSVGWPFFEKQNIKFYNFTNDNDKISILFISQGTIGELLSQLAVQLAEFLDLDKYELIYKLHPGEYDEWEKRYPWLLVNGIIVIDNNDKNMHYYFANANIQIGVYSTAIYEGLGYGLKTYILTYPGHEQLSELYENGYAILVQTVGELVDEISSNKIPHAFDLSFFWKKNSLENIKQEIINILKSE